MKNQGKYGVKNDAMSYCSKGKMKNASAGRVMSYSKDLSSRACSRPVGRTSWAAGYKSAGTDAV
tara:strand:+ start:24073 stop:24264 length:192 start_codon:yes stop_codon:yes gene_type:complete